jgi:hypothetical protein
MVGDIQNMAADDKGSMLAASTNYHAAVDGRQRGVAGFPGSLTTLDQDSAQPAIALAGLGAAPLASALVVTEGHPSPAVQMAGAGKAAHACADFRQDRCGGDALDAGNGAQQLKLLGERAQVLLDPRGQRTHRFLQVVELGQGLADQERVMVAEAPRQRLAQGRQLGAQAAPGELASAPGRCGRPPTGAESYLLWRTCLG